MKAFIRGCEVSKLLSGKKKTKQTNEVQTRACAHLYIEKGQFQEDTEGDDIDCHWGKGPGD